jgi:hypothetical protein
MSWRLGSDFDSAVPRCSTNRGANWLVVWYPDTALLGNAGGPFVMVRGQRMQPWYIATETFTSRNAEAWKKYVAWSGLKQLDEVVSLDPMLCPSLLPEIKPEYWPHIVNEDFMLDFFVDLEFLLGQISGVAERNLLCVYRNPPSVPALPTGSVNFEFLGYDLIDVQASASALTNCGGFPDVFDNGELSSKGLLTSHARAFQVRSELRARHAEEHHANCHVWAISRAVAP